MNIELLKKESCTLEFKLTFPAEAVQKAYETSLTKAVSKARIPGFRKGKVPRSRVESMYRVDIIEGTVDALYSGAFLDVREFLTKNNVYKIVDRTIESFDKDQPLDLVLTAEIMPEVEKRDFSNVTLQLVKGSVSDDDVTSMIDRLRIMQANYQKIEVDEPFGPGTIADIAFVGKTGDEEFKGGSSDSYMLDHDNEQMIPGFTAAIVGHKAGENFDINVTFPKDYTSNELAGKDATFNITIHKVYRPVKADINEELLTKLGLDPALGEAGFRDHIRQNLELQLQQNILRANHKAMIEAVVGQYSDVTFPPSMIKEAAAKASKHFKRPVDDAFVQQLASTSLYPVVFGLVKDKFEADSDVDFKVTEEDVRNEASRIAIAYDGNAEEFVEDVIKQESPDSKDMYSKISAMCQDRKILEFFAKQFKVETVDIKVKDMELLNAYGNSYFFYKKENEKKEAEAAKAE